MTIDPNAPTVLVPIVKIDPPLLPVRSKFDDERFAELKASIQRHGLIQPIVLFLDGERYRVVAGHRRYTAFQELGISEIKATIVSADDGLLESLKVDENYRRENVNPADEGEHLKVLFETMCENDIEQVVHMTGLSFSYVSDRINLVNGDERIREAVRDGKLLISVANEFNRIKSPLSRGAALHDAQEYGCTSKQARLWRTDYNLRFEREQAAANGTPMPDPVPTSSTPVGPVCIVCEKSKDPHELELLYVHSYCNRAKLQEILDALHGRQDG